MRTLTIAVFGIALAGPAAGHSWFPWSCCSNQDCYEVPADRVVATPEGWLLLDTEEVIPYDKARETPPEGGEGFYRCSMSGNPTLSTLGVNLPQRCLWAPPFGG